MAQSSEATREQERATRPIQRCSRKDGGTDIVVEEERSGQVSPDVEVHKVGGRGCVEADGAPKVADPVRLDRGLVVSTVVCFD